MNRWTDGKVNECVDGCIMDGRLDRWINGQMEEWMGGWVMDEVGGGNSLNERSDCR